VHRLRATRLFNNNNNNNFTVTQATPNRFIRQSEFPPCFLVLQGTTFRTRNLFIDILKIQTKVKGKTDPVRAMKECEGMDV
jgi:hypothetical protein